MQPLPLGHTVGGEGGEGGDRVSLTHAMRPLPLGHTVGGEGGEEAGGGWRVFESAELALYTRMLPCWWGPHTGHTRATHGGCPP